MKSYIILGLALCLLASCTSAKPDFPHAARHIPSNLPTDVLEPDPNEPPPPLVFVWGNVVTPGQYQWKVGMRMRDGITAAGGLNQFATRKLYLFSWDGSSKTIYTNPDKFLTNNPPLMPGDSVISPKENW
jgi:hypothetical protein